MKQPQEKRLATLFTPTVNGVYAESTNSGITPSPPAIRRETEPSTIRRKVIPCLTVSLIVVIGLNGCVLPECCFSYNFQGDKGAVHYLILGIGLVSVPKPNTDTAILATRVHALGVNLSDQPGLKLAVGYSSSSVVTISDGAEDIRVEISQRPGGKLEIETQSARLKKK